MNLAVLGRGLACFLLLPLQLPHHRKPGLASSHPNLSDQATISIQERFSESSRTRRHLGLMLSKHEMPRSSPKQSKSPYYQVKCCRVVVLHGGFFVCLFVCVCDMPTLWTIGLLLFIWRCLCCNSGFSARIWACQGKAETRVWWSTFCMWASVCTQWSQKQWFIKAQMYSMVSRNPCSEICYGRFITSNSLCS